MVDVAKDLTVTENRTLALQKFNKVDADLAELEVKYMVMVVQNPTDKDGFDMVHKARMDVRDRRTDFVKDADEMRADAVRFQKWVIEQVKPVEARAKKIEAHLQAQEDIVNNEKERLKKLEAEKEAARIQLRVDKVCAFGATFDGQQYTVAGISLPHALLKVANDEQFEMFLGNIQKNVEAEKARIEEAARGKKEEEDRLEKERETERLRMADENRKLHIKTKIQGLRDVYVTPDMDSERIKALIDAYEKKAVASEDYQEFLEEAKEVHSAVLKNLCNILITTVNQESAKAEQAIRDAEKAEENKQLQAKLDELQREKDKLEADKKAKEDEEKRKADEIERQKELDKAKKEAAAKALKDAEEKAQKAKELAERKAARQPDKVKILLIADTLDAIQTPDVKTEDGKAVALAVMMAIAELVKKIRDQVEEEL